MAWIRMGGGGKVTPKEQGSLLLLTNVSEVSKTINNGGTLIIPVIAHNNITNATYTVYVNNVEKGSFKSVSNKTMNDGALNIVTEVKQGDVLKLSRGSTGGQYASALVGYSVI